MHPLKHSLLLSSLVAAVVASNASAAGLSPSTSRFYYRDFSGRTSSARIVRHYWKTPRPPGKVDPRMDQRLVKAASIADERANARTRKRCWQYVKEALLAAGAVTSYPKTSYANQAGSELAAKYGFKKLSVRDPYAAPVGAVIVYGGRIGHVEIRTRHGFASDYHSKNRCFYPVLAVYGKFSS